MIFARFDLLYRRRNGSYRNLKKKKKEKLSVAKTIVDSRFLSIDGTVYNSQGKKFKSFRNEESKITWEGRNEFFLPFLSANVNQDCKESFN